MLYHSFGESIPKENSNITTTQFLGVRHKMYVSPKVRWVENFNFFRTNWYFLLNFRIKKLICAFFHFFSPLSP